MKELLEENKQLKKEIDTLKTQVIKITTTICTDLSCQIRSKDFTTLTKENNEETELN
nr:MAG TPA: aminoacyl tRNA synthase complex protein [Bacteriophage sp.]